MRTRISRMARMLVQTCVILFNLLMIIRAIRVQRYLLCSCNSSIVTIVTTVQAFLGVPDKMMSADVTDGEKKNDLRKCYVLAGGRLLRLPF